MIDQQKIEKLNQLADRLTSSAEPIFAGRDYAPFDVSRPNLHETKKEFLEGLCCTNWLKSEVPLAPGRLIPRLQ